MKGHTMPAEKAKSIDDLSPEAVDCRLDGHRWEPRRNVPLVVTRDSGGREASRRRACLSGCEVVKTEFYEVDPKSGRLPWVKSVMDYKKAEKYCMEKGHGRVDRAELRFDVEYGQIQEPPSVKKPARAKATKAKAKAKTR